VAALLLQIVNGYATQTVARGVDIHAVDVIDLVLISGLIYLLMRQVPSIAAGLGGGVAIATAGVMSGTAAWGLRNGILAGKGAYWAGKGAWWGVRRGWPYAKPAMTALGRALRNRGNTVRAGVSTAPRNTIHRDVRSAI